MHEGWGGSTPRHKLKGLLAGMTEENRHPEIDTGPAVGCEFPNGYPPAEDALLAHIDANIDQEELAGGEPGEHFEW